MQHESNINQIHVAHTVCLKKTEQDQKDQEVREQVEVEIVAEFLKSSIDVPEELSKSTLLLWLLKVFIKIFGLHKVILISIERLWPHSYMGHIWNLLCEVSGIVRRHEQEVLNDEEADPDGVFAELEPFVPVIQTGLIVSIFSFEMAQIVLDEALPGIFEVRPNGIRIFVSSKVLIDENQRILYPYHD